MLLRSRSLLIVLMLTNFMTNCREKKDNPSQDQRPPESEFVVNPSPPLPLPPEPPCLLNDSCIDATLPFVLGESMPFSRPKLTSIGKKDDVSPTGELRARGVDEVKTLYGADRSIDWSGLEFIEQQKSKLDPFEADTILQAFNMSYQYIEAQIPQLHKAGYKIIQISPPQKTLDLYGIWWESYQPVDNRSFENKFGTEKELRTLIASAHSLGMKVIADTVLNHMADPSRFDQSKPLQYSDLYQPKDFENYDIYTDLMQYRMQILQSKVDELLFFYSPDRALYQRFQKFLELRNLDIKSILSQTKQRATYELAFVKEQFPWMYSDLKRLVGNAGVKMSFSQDVATCLQFGNSRPCTANVDFMKQWNALFGRGALIVRSYYFELTADKSPIFENEWDNLEKVHVKWYPGLPSLNKSSSYVKQTHVDLLEKMLRIGFDGFRLDAVKHIPQEYFSDLIMDLQDRFKDSSDAVDGEIIRDKKLYVYGEMATSKVDIANAFRKGMDVTDFFLLDTYMYATVFKETMQIYGRGEENWQKLRKNYLLESLSKGNNKDWQMMLYPIPKEANDSWFDLKSFDKVKYIAGYKQPIYFSRIHDSVVGDMFILKNYQQAMLGHAYMLSSTEGRVLIYGSDEDVAINAGADYKEKVVLAGIKFRQLAGKLPYTDRFENKDFCSNCQRNDLMFIDRGAEALAILYSGTEALPIEQLQAPNLEGGCYVELMSGRSIRVDELHTVSRRDEKSLTLPPRSLYSGECL